MVLMDLNFPKLRIVAQSVVLFFKCFLFCVIFNIPYTKVYKASVLFLLNVNFPVVFVKVTTSPPL